MSIKFVVVPSPFESNKFFVRTVHESVYTLDEAVSDITQETALTESEVRGVAAALTRRRDEALLAGRRVDFGDLGRYTLNVRATLDSADAPLPADYEMVVLADVPRRVSNWLRSRASVARKKTSTYQPLINSFFDAATKQDAVYSTSMAARINGAFLKFDENDAQQGVFFVAEDGSAVRATVYLYVGSTRVEFNIPPGLTGPQSVEVRTKRKLESALLVSDPLGPLDPA